MSFVISLATAYKLVALKYHQLTEANADRYAQKEWQQKTTFKLRDMIHCERKKAQTGEKREKEQQVQNSCKPSEFFYH